jgi:hypothetical protein
MDANERHCGILTNTSNLKMRNIPAGPRTYTRIRGTMLLVFWKFTFLLLLPVVRARSHGGCAQIW